MQQSPITETEVMSYYSSLADSLRYFYENGVDLSVLRKEDGYILTFKAGGKALTTRVGSTTNKEAEAAREWSRGYFCAVANILRTHGDDVIAKDAARGGGIPSIDEVCPEDLEILVKHGVLNKASLTKKPAHV